MNFDLEYAKTVIINEAAAIGRMETLIASPSFVNALQTIYNCKGSVIVSGMGKAGIIGQKISSTMASVGTPSHFLHPAEAIHGDLGRIRKNDIVLILSFGGETSEVIRLINLLKQQEIKIIAITGNNDSRLSKHSDIVLDMGKLSEACPLGIAPSVSTTCMLAIGDSIALTVMKAKNFGAEDYARFHPGGSLGAKLITVSRSMMFKSDEKLPLANANDTAQHMLDKNKKLKRHGAVMVIDDKGKLVGIVTDADFRRAVVEKGPSVFETKISQIMTSDCKRIRQDSLAAEAMALFHKFRIDDLPVVDENDIPVGLIDIQDIVSIKIVN